MKKTVGVFIAEIIYYLKTGRTSTVATIPQITLKTSKQGPMFYEKRIMKKFDVAWQKLTADDRQKNVTFQVWHEVKTYHRKRTNKRKPKCTIKSHIQIKRQCIYRRKRR